MEVKIENRPLTYLEKKKLDEGEQKVIWAYEKATGQPFMRFDLIILKNCLKKGTPEQVCSVIFDAAKKYKDNFTTFGYIYKWISNTYLRRNLRGGKDK